MGNEMDFAKLVLELRRNAGDRLMRTSQCLDEHELAGVATGTLSAELHEHVKKHLADCDYCIARIGELARLVPDSEAEPISDLLVARARRLAAGQDRGAAPRRVAFAPWAAAAVVVLAVAVVLQKPWSPVRDDGTISDRAPAAKDAPSVVRRIDPEALRPRITAPAPESVVSLRSAEFTWTGVEGSLYYEVFILNDSGDVLWQQRAEGTSLTLPAEAPLEPGREFFARVDAYLAEARRISSQHVIFSVDR